MCPGSHASKETTRQVASPGQWHGQALGMGTALSAGAVKACMCPLPPLTENIPARAGAQAWQNRGAAGAALADSFKMSQWEPKSGWHPVFNLAAGWQTGGTQGRLRAGPCLHTSQSRQGIGMEQESARAEPPTHTHLLLPSTGQEGIAPSPATAQMVLVMVPG